MSKSKIKKLFYLVCQSPIYFLSFLIKKDPTIWLFGSWAGQLYNDNSKYLFEYIIDEKKDVKAYWLTKNKKLLKELRDSNKQVLYCFSLKGMYIQLRAGACFFTQSHSLDFLGSAVYRNSLLVQLWHGMPLKKILNDDQVYVKGKESKLKVVLDKFFPWLKDEWDIVICPSVQAEKIFRSAFGEDIKIINSGFPRNEKLLKGNCNPNLTKKIESIIYMPTFRGRSGTTESNYLIEEYLNESGFDFDKINSLCLTKNINFYIKLHPSNKLRLDLEKKIVRLSNIFLIKNNFDFYKDVNNFDLLITDYSSVFFDFIVTGNPVLHVAFDLQKYIAESRDLYFDYEDIKIGKDFYNWSDVINYVSLVDKSDILNSENYKKSFDLMNNNVDSSCEFIYAEVKDILK